MKKSTLLMMSIVIILFFAIASGMVLKTRSDDGHSENDWMFGDFTELHDSVEFDQPMMQEENKETNETQIEAKSLEEAKKLSKEKDMPILICFHTEWCWGCQKMEKVFKDENVKKAMTKYVLLHVDTDHDKVTTRKFKVRSIPHHVITDSTEDVKESLIGPRDAKTFEKWLNDFIKK